MNDKTILLIGGGALLFLVMSKRANARVVPNAGGVQPGTNYATPTKTAAAVAGAVNGILNWLSGTPAQASPVTGIGGEIDLSKIGNGGEIDALDGIWDNAMDSIGNVFGGGFNLGLGNDGSLTGNNPQNGSQVGLASFFNTNLGLQ